MKWSKLFLFLNYVYYSHSLSLQFATITIIIKRVKIYQLYNFSGTVPPKVQAHKEQSQPSLLNYWLLENEH